MLKTKEYFFFIVFFFFYLLFILPQSAIFFTNDSINYIRNAIIIKTHLYELQLEISEKNFYPLFYSLILSNFISTTDVVELQKCYNELSLCKIYFKKVIIFQSIISFLTGIITFLIADILFKKKSISYLAFFIFFLNSYYYSRIFFITPEVPSIFLFTLNFLFIILFLNKKKLIFYLLLVFVSSTLILLKPIFLIINFLFFLYILIIKKITLKYFIIFLSFLISIFLISSNYKKVLFNDHDFKYEMTVIEQRTAYGIIKYNEIIPLFVSFIPKIGDDLNKVIFNNNTIKKVEPQQNKRNFFYNNRDKILAKNNGVSPLKKIFYKNLQNFDKQIILTPIFLFRGIFMQSGNSDYFINFNGIFIKLFIYLNYLIFSISKLYLLYVCVRSLFLKHSNSINISLIYPGLVFLIHSVLTHNLPRYTSIMFILGVIFLLQKLHNIIIYNQKKKDD